MKNRHILISAAVVAMVLLTSHATLAQPTTSHRCNDQLIKGTYGFVVEGERLMGPPPLGPLKGVALTTFDGKGGLTQVDSISTNGFAAADFSPPANGSYSVNSDCTGTFSLVFQDGRPAVTVNFVVTTDGFEIDTVVVGVCVVPNSSPPCTGQGVNSIRSIGKQRFPGQRS
jgi:hypothetical protein